MTNFSVKLLENEKSYFRHLAGVISSVDERATINITRRLSGLTVRIAPSDYEGFIMILRQIKNFHTKIGIVVEFSKSMKAGSNICFNINFEEKKESAKERQKH